MTGAMQFDEALFIWCNILMNMFLNMCLIVQPDSWERYLTHICLSH